MTNVELPRAAARGQNHLAIDVSNVERSVYTVQRTLANPSPTSGDLLHPRMPGTPLERLFVDWISILTSEFVLRKPNPRYIYRLTAQLANLLNSLYSSTVPEDPALRLRLINAYFERIHPLRCLAFIHKPSFMHAFHRASVDQEYGEPLLHIMCALGARSIALCPILSSSAKNL